MKTCPSTDLDEYATLPVPFWSVFRAFDCSGYCRQLSDKLASDPVLSRNGSLTRHQTLYPSQSRTKASQSWLKKRYEQTEKTRQAKAYLDEVEIINDEVQLMDMAISEESPTIPQIFPTDKQPTEKSMESSPNQQVKRTSSTLPPVKSTANGYKDNSFSKANTKKSICYLISDKPTSLDAVTDQANYLTENQ
ncbi:hypothetical protein ACOME3_010270 [Neoechinorhynchus agilis]